MVFEFGFSGVSLGLMASPLIHKRGDEIAVQAGVQPVHRTQHGDIQVRPFFFLGPESNFL